MIHEAGFFLENGLFEAPPALPPCRAARPRSESHLPVPCPSLAFLAALPHVSPWSGHPWLGRDLGRRVGRSLLQPVLFSTSLLTFTRLVLPSAHALVLAGALVPQGRLYLRRQVMDSPSHPPGTCLFHRLIIPVA